MNEALFKELRELFDRGFTGSVTLHSHEGQVQRYTVNEIRRPRTPERVDLTEGR